MGIAKSARAMLLSMGAAVAMMSAAAAGIPIPSGLAGTWSGNVTFSPMGPRSTQLPNGGASFLEVSTLGVDGSFFMRQMAFDQLFRVPAKHGTAVQVRHRLQCSECGTVSVRPAVTAHSRDPQGRAPLSPREPGGPSWVASVTPPSC